jgi:His/Glu/Gln/Arg/opine family amino acid ABC transporter permease subunit
MGEAAVERPQREPWLGSQTGGSLATFLIGMAAIVLPVLGSVVLLLAGGVLSSDDVVATINSPTQGLILWAGVALGALAFAVALFIYKGMPTKAAREATVIGGALGIQAVALSAIYLLFRTGDPEIFIRNFFSLEQLRGLGDAFIRGALNTVILAFGGELLGIVIGLTLAMLVLSNRAVIRAPARAYINLFRGTPLLWQLLFISTVMIVGFGLFRRDPYPVAIIILGLNAGGYSAEIFRAGIHPAPGHPAGDPSVDERVRDPDQGHVAGCRPRSDLRPAGAPGGRTGRRPGERQFHCVPGHGPRLPGGHAAPDPSGHVAGGEAAQRPGGCGGVIPS